MKQRFGQQDAQQECRVIHPCPGTVFKAYHLQIHTRIHLGLKGPQAMPYFPLSHPPKTVPLIEEDIKEKAFQGAKMQES